MLTKRIIPCLDMRGGKVVTGINFKNIKEVGDPPTMAIDYEGQGADEITFLDISASQEERATMLDVVTKTAEGLNVPLCVGGGIRSVQDVRNTLNAGADKVSMKSFSRGSPKRKKPQPKKIVLPTAYKAQMKRLRLMRSYCFPP